MAVPMRLIEKRGDLGVVELGGVRREVSLQLLDEVEVNDYVIVHAGFAIERLDEDVARETLELFKAMEVEIHEI
jgi:hydrogenase expression/formation protein HypC